MQVIWASHNQRISLPHNRIMILTVAGLGYAESAIWSVSKWAVPFQMVKHAVGIDQNRLPNFTPSPFNPLLYRSLKNVSNAKALSPGVNRKSIISSFQSAPIPNTTNTGLRFAPAPLLREWTTPSNTNMRYWTILPYYVKI
jgi:hypothetical protein